MDELSIEIEKKVRAKQPVTVDEYLYLLNQSQQAFWAFLISNNPGNVNDTLRHKLAAPYTELGFNPDKVKLARIIEMIMQKNDESELMEVLKNFELKTEGLDEEFIKKFTQDYLS